MLTDIHKPLTRDNYQHDFAATLRFDINPYWLVKLEGHYIDGTTDVSPALNGGTRAGDAGAAMVSLSDQDDRLFLSADDHAPPTIIFRTSRRWAGAARRAG